nr:exodeoxyribonuclease III [Metabacillus lacus]
MVSWNVNGIRACTKKGFLTFFDSVDADVFCLQETKVQAGQIDLKLNGYHQYWNYAEKKGYSGTAVFTKAEPITVSYGLNGENSEPEGRILTLEFPEFYLVNVYTPNSKRDLSRLPYRLEWEDRLREHLLHLNQHKPVIYCGDLNVAHQEIDLKNPKPNRGNSGFTEEERGKMTALLSAGFTDTFRYCYPEKTGSYTWWSYMSKVRERNIGWRIDYFLICDCLKSMLTTAQIHGDILGSDHCPVSITLAMDA